MEVFGNVNLFCPTWLSFQLDTAIQNALNVSRLDILKPPSEQISTEKIPFVLTFHPFDYKIRDIVIQNFDILKSDP